MTRALTLVRRLLPALIVLAALLARLAPGARTIDDAYITFRYARNLLAGFGPVFNPGEAVLGTTTPLYMGLMALLGALTGGVDAPFPLLALLINALADAATALLLWQFGKRLGSERAGVAAALAWAVAPFSVTFAIGGLETSLYVLLLTACVFFAFTRRRNLAALAASLALLTRPDALILLGPLALERLYCAIWKKERLGWLEVGLAFAPLLAWGGIATLFYGSPLPHSITAKVAAYHLGAGEGLIRLIQHYATPFMEYKLLPTPVAIGMGVLLYPFLALVGTLRALKNQPQRHREHGETKSMEEGNPTLALPSRGEGRGGVREVEAVNRLAAGVWLIYPWLYLATFAIANPLIFRWYLTPPLPAYFLAILLGMDAVLSGVVRWLFRAKNLPQRHGEHREKIDEKDLGGGSLPASGEGRGGVGVPRAHAVPWAHTVRPYSGVAVLIVMLLWCLAPQLAEWRVPDHGSREPAPEMAFIKLELLYRQAAEILAPRLSPATTLAAGDVGVLGYFTPARILDTVGLNSPVSTRYYPLPAEDYEINYAIPARLITDQKPDYVVILEVYGRRTLLKDDIFLSQYQLLETLETDMYGSRGMLLFARR